MKLEDVEKAYNFTYPALYKKLEADGMLDVGEDGPSWYHLVYPQLCKNPTLLFHTIAFTLLNVRKAYEAIAELTNPNAYWNVDSRFRFIPFAEGNTGEYYCFFLTRQQDGDVPIVLLSLDHDGAIYLGKNLQDYIFITILSEMDDLDVYDEPSEKEFRTNEAAMLETHGKYLQTAQLDILQEILKRPVKNYEISYPNGKVAKFRGLLTNVELTTIINKMCPFDKMNDEFQYSLQ